jgi:hypothetical protein
MALQILYNANILVNSVDLSSKCRKLKVNFGQEKKETSAFGNTARTFMAGVLTPSAEAEFYIDRSTGSVLQTLRALVNGPSASSTGFTLSIRAVNSAATTSNEVYTMAAIIDGGIDAINGNFGDIETMSVKFANASATGLATATTS